ncbi:MULTISPECIES: autotransporter outer membrane beta-barrel domain-containing protein [unclassified Enterobacter]|uniref:autotransporter outer membrane beta-barrel domain-containing protein n=1 Tax=unclassified Enterobacter TaxID=2608935 RepID=UPI0015CC656C|nr:MULTISPECIES: autotransporter outer membrane beta-barrel domain-containing protein [unclassified Enterobacter]MBB3306070.1 autotransporter family porin [Enterobacter sp. Sphag1F]NYI14582.1 autotransporter family porin [Enterobacter sp. Sphag71]
MRFTLNPIALGMLAAQLLIYPAMQSQAVTLGTYTPQNNDNQIGKITVSSGNETLTGNQAFTPGTDGAVTTTLGQVAITSGSQYLNQDRLDPGPQNFAITTPDAATGTNSTFQVYNSASLVALAPVTSATSVPDVQNVNNGQYIDARIADVTGGTLDVNIGQANALSSASTNSWTMAAKQTELFDVSGSGTVNWNSNNRISFFGATATPDGAGSATSSYQVQNLATYNGAFSVQTLDGKSTSFTVTNASQLQSYNNWLISQLQSGNLDKTRYLTEFNKAVTFTNANIVYNVSATPPDEVTQPILNRIVINASGAGAKVNLAAGKTLEVVGATGGAIKASNGAQAVIDGKLASRGSITNNGTALVLTDNSSGINNGVINGGFLNRQDGTGIGSTGYGANGVAVQTGSTFNNNGILNFATTGSNSQYGVAGINLGVSSTANNSGNINVGVNGSSARGTASGVLLTDATSSFTNNASGNIYIGRGPQNSLGEATADTAMNQSGLTSGIALVANGNAVNDGSITIGTKTQNAAGMSATGANNATMINTGTINVNGAAATIPRENVGMLVTNSAGNINNAGTINLNGVNGTGLKVLATNGNTASATSTGTINVAGGADPASGTRNYGVWVEGQGTGTAQATVDGPINLSGNGAIGVHARGNSTVTVDPAAVPTFSNGTNQIAFFAYGPNAVINVLGNDPFDVTTQNSTLFRVEQGADFHGNALSLTASGAGSTAVLGSGAGTEVSSDAAVINVSGSGANGITVEGGATGVIDAATTMNLTGSNTIGAIVDGQKHDIFGRNSGSPVTSTSLNSAAALNASQSGLTGYVARNRAQLTNTGDITFTGANSTGIRVESGATGTNSGNININDGGTGIAVNSGSSTFATTANNTGTINVNGGSTTSRSRGVSASGNRAVANLNGGTLNLNGTGAIGAEALNGALVNIAAGSAPVFNNSDQIAYHAAGSGSRISSATNALDINSSGSTGYRIDDGAALSFTTPTTLTSSASNSTGAIISGSGSSLNSSNANFTASGQGSTAIRAEGGANATLDSGSSINLSGSNAVGVLVNNLRTDLSNALDGSAAATRVTSNGNVSGAGNGAIGFDVTNGAELVNNGNVNLTGSNNIGIRSRAGSTLTNNGVVNVANGTGLDVSGSGSTLAKGGTINVDNGTAGVRISDGAQLALTGSDTVITTRGNAHGILLDSGATALSASDATVNVLGSGNGIENRAELSNVGLSNLTINVGDGNGIRTAVPFDPASTVTTNVNGSGTGLNIANADGSTTSGDLTLGSGYQFNVTGAGGTGIRANTTGNVTTAANVNIDNAAGGSALVSSTAGTIVNTGNFTSNSLTAPVVDLRGGKTIFENLGNIITANPQTVAVAGSNADDEILLTEGAVQGDINPGGGSDLFRWTGGTLNGSLTMGNDNNNTAEVSNVDLGTTYHLTSGTGTGNTLTFNQIDSRGGSFSADDLSKGVNLGSGWSTINFANTKWTLTDNLQLAHSTINVDAGSTLFAGDNVHPTLSGGTADSLVVNNAGTLDLTNGAGSPGNTLDIAGSLASSGGQLNLVTNLNEGGALSNQFTDHLNVTGNASGTTLVNVKLTDASTGALTDLNQNGGVEGNEGISLAQVGGNASANSFALKDGYLGAGPWQYRLYTFAPGSSDPNQRLVSGSGNNYWDYRLANYYVCEDSNSCQPTFVTDAFGTPQSYDSRPAVVPQVPSYVSAPVGLAYYTSAIIDDLHKRLGELRHEQTRPEGNGGEMFLRYIGSNLKYNSDKSFRDFGYDFDLDYSAVQVGGNLLRLDGEQDSLRGGLAYTRGNTRIRPHAADGYSSTTFDSDSLAFYGTWQRQSGFYLDGVLSFDWHRGETDIARTQEVAKLKGNGWTASLESGYPFELGDGYKLEPQAQLMYMKLNMDDFTDKDGNKVRYGDYNQTIGRLGARLDRTWTDDSNRQYTPYLRANYYKGWGGTADTSVSSVDNPAFGATFSSGKFGQMWELGAGGTATLQKDVSLYAEADYRKEIEGNGAKGWRYNVGVRWQF